MNIIAHRGLWVSPAQRNTRDAFLRCIELGLGTELDLRDAGGHIVVSHDMPVGGELSFEELLQDMKGSSVMLALNIKADGLAQEIQRLLTLYKHETYFTFDMSIPDMITYMDAGLNVYTGISDVQSMPVLPRRARGAWLDSFFTDWFSTEMLDDVIARTENCCIVSADLHGRPVNKQWFIISQSRYINRENLMLCTDRVQEAKEFFYGKN